MKYAVLQIVEDEIVHNIGVLLLDADDELHIRLLDDWSRFSHFHRLYLSELAEDLRNTARTMNPAELFGFLSDSLSGTLRITPPVTVIADSPERVTDELFAEHVTSY